MSEEKVDRSLAFLLHYFFKEYLTSQRGLSPNTIGSYKEAFKIFIPWIVQKNQKNKPTIDDVSLMLIFDFLNYLEKERKNSIQTRNIRLAALKTFFQMCYFLLPDTKKIFEGIKFVKFKKTSKPLIDYFEHDEVIKILNVVDKTSQSGMRDFTLLNVLYDTGMRASEIASLRLSHYQMGGGTLEIIGKGNKWRKIKLWPRTQDLLKKYIEKGRWSSKLLYQDTLFINQDGEALTRSGIYKICRKYQEQVPDLKKRFINSKRSPVHSWRHTAAVQMIRQGHSLLEVKVRLGHAQLESTLKYLNLDLTTKGERIKEFVHFINQSIGEKYFHKVDWDNEAEMIEFLKNL